MSPPTAPTPPERPAHPASGRGLARAAALLAGAALASQAQAQEAPPLVVVAHTGLAVPGGAGGLVSLAEPAAGLSGHLVFRAGAISTAAGSGVDTDGIWRVAPDGRVDLVARTNALVPASTTTSVNLASILVGPSVDDAGNVAFGGRMTTVSGVSTSNRDVLWVTASTFADGVGSTPDLWVAARQSNLARVAPGASPGPASLATFVGARLAPDGTLLYAATLAGTGFNGVAGTWALERPAATPASGAPRLVALAGDLAPGTGGLTWTAVDLGTGTKDAVAFVGEAATTPGSAASLGGLWTGGPDLASSALVTTGAAAPGLAGDATLVEVGRPAADGSGAVAWWGGLQADSTPEGLWLRRGGRHEPLALAGRPAPGLGEGWTFATFDDPVVAPGGHAAFLAWADGPGGARKAGLWTGGSGATLRLVAAEGDPLAGQPGLVLGTPDAPHVNRLGMVGFVATLRSAADPAGPAAGEAVLVTDFSGALVTVARTGVPLAVPGRADSPLDGLRLAAFTEAGLVAVLGTRADGTHVLARATLPRPTLPAFAAWAAAAGLPAGTQPGDDPDGDGLANALEHALGLDPVRRESPEDVGLPRLLLAPTSGLAEGTPVATFAYDQPPEGSGIAWRLQASLDLETWHEGTAFLAEIDRRPLPNGRQRVTVVDRLERPDGPVFVRLVVGP